MNKTFIIAELSANHGHKLEVALDSVVAAKEIGVDAIKIQTYTADTLTLNCDKPEFMADPNGIWKGYTSYQLYQEAYTPWEWHEAIFRKAREVGLTCFSTPFDYTAVDFLEKIDCPIYKIASPEITDIPLIEYVASKGKPMIISTGVATIEDIENALNACYKVGNRDITLLKCTSSYPAPIKDANLLTIPDMKKKFGVMVGLSDHTLGQDAAIAAVALGATVLEKHFIIDRAIGGPDSSFSMSKGEFAKLVESVRTVEAALGSVYYPTDPETISGRKFARSLYVAKNMKKGEEITRENVRSIRPGYGLPPKYMPELIGRHVNRDLEMGTPMSFDYLED